MNRESIDLNTVEAVLDEYVRPVLSSHGGDLEIIRLEGDTLYFRLKGACAGCPAADLTSEDLVNKELTERVEGLKRAVLENTVSPELIEQALNILKKDKHS